jgi:hypothetical protein
VAYGDDISGLSADHHWPFDGDSNDAIGSANGTNTSIVFTGSTIAQDSTNSVVMDAVGDRISIPTTTDINNSAQTVKAVGGWFQTTGIQQPFTRIYGEGNTTTNFQLCMGFGNFLTFEARDSSFQVQIYSSFGLALSRSYHLFMRFSGSGDNNIMDLFIDGIKQLNAQPTDRQPDDASIASRGVAEFGDPAGTVGLNGTDLVMVAPGQTGQSNYSHWATWDGTELTDDEVRETLFERGALAQSTISTNTEANMQSAVDALGTSRGNHPCDIEVEAVTGGGNFVLDFDGFTFDNLASIHVRYNGTADTLTVRNVNGSNIDSNKVSAPFGGSIVLVEEQTITVTVQNASDFSAISGARVLLTADSGGDRQYQESITSITRSGSTATVTQTAHGLSTNDRILIAGANQNEYNGLFDITVTGTNTYTYTVSGTPTTPATGSPVSTYVLIDSDTNGSGIASTVYNYSTDQPVTGVVRKGSSSTYFKTSVISGTITSAGFDQTTLMVSDE